MRAWIAFGFVCLLAGPAWSQTFRVTNAPVAPTYTYSTPPGYYQPGAVPTYVQPAPYRPAGPQIVPQPASQPTQPRPAAGATTGANPVVRREVYIPRASNGAPRGMGLSGLGVPLDRRAYQGSRYARPSPTYGGILPGTATSAAAGPARTFTPGQQLQAPNNAAQPQRYVLTTTFDSAGGQRSILYDTFTGQAREFVSTTNVDNLGPRANPATRNSPPAPTYGFGTGSFSGNVTSTNVDAFGPFGSGSGGTGIPSVNPVSPNVGNPPIGSAGVP